MTISLSALFSYDFLFHADLWIIFSLKRQKRKLRKKIQKLNQRKINENNNSNPPPHFFFKFYVSLTILVLVYKVK